MVREARPGLAVEVEVVDLSMADKDVLEKAVSCYHLHHNLISPELNY